MEKGTATLDDWYAISKDGRKILIGIIYNDSNGRFKDGSPIRTSLVKKCDEKNNIAETLNTIYFLKNKKIGSGTIYE